MKSLRRIILLCLAWCISLPAFAAPALWRLADSDTTIYIFGTLHVMEADLPWFSPNAAKAFAESKVLIVELDDTELQKAGPLFAAAARLPNTTNLRMVVGNGLYNDVERISKQLGVPVNAFSQARPWFTAMSLGVGAMVRAGYNPASGADKALLAAAEEAHKPVVSLETAEFQAGLFEGLPADAEKILLIETLKEVGHMKQSFGAMQDAWMAGDPEKLATLINGTLVSNPALAERMLYARNRDWQDKMMQLLDNPGSFFVAVGAGHLGGEGSMIALIRADGIPVNRVE